MTEQDTASLQLDEIFPKKCRRAVTLPTLANNCRYCGDPFVEPKRKRFVILGPADSNGWGWGLISICFECWKHEWDGIFKWEQEHPKRRMTVASVASELLATALDVASP